MTLRSILALTAGLLAAGCSAHAPSPDETSSGGKLTGVSSSERGIHFQSFVYVPVDASDDAIKIAIARQVKTAIGALRTPKVSLDDRGAQSNLDPSTWSKNILTVNDPANPARQVLRVTYKYNDR